MSEEQKKVEAIWKAEKKGLIEKQEKLEKQLDEEKTLRIKKEFKEKASEFKHLGVETDSLAETLRLVQKNAPEHYGEVEKILKTADETIGKSAMFSEFGSNVHTQGGSAWSKIEKAAEAIKKDGETSQQAIDRYIQTEEGSKLYNEYNNGGVQ